MKMPVPRSALCRECGYLLDGLPQPRCPECGTGFDWGDDTTVHVPGRFRLPPGVRRSIEPLLRFVLSPVGRWPIIVAGLGCLLMLWSAIPPDAQRFRSIHAKVPLLFVEQFEDDRYIARKVCFGFGYEDDNDDLSILSRAGVFWDVYYRGWGMYPLMLIKGIQLFVVAIVWLTLRWIVRWSVAIFVDRPDPSPRHDGRRWAAIATVEAVTFSLIALDVPFRLAFAMSRSSLDHLVEQANALPPITQLPPQSVGLYRCGTFDLGDPEQAGSLPPGVFAAAADDPGLKATWKDAAGRVWVHIVGTTDAAATVFNSPCSTRFPYWWADGSGFVWSPDGPPPTLPGQRVRRITDDGWYVWTTGEWHAQSEEGEEVE